MRENTIRMICATMGATIVAAILGTPFSAGAAVIFSTGFEDPPFTAGPLVNGTDGWSGASFLPIDIDTAVFKSGAQSMRQTNSSNTSLISRAVSEPTAGQIFTLDLDYMNNGNALNKIGFDTFFEQRTVGAVTDVFMRNSNGATPSVIVDRSQWHHLQMVLNYQTLSVSGKVDGISLGSIALSPATTLGDFSHIASLGTPSQFVYDDNVSLTVVPEPASLGLLVVGAAGLLSRRRRA